MNVGSESSGIQRFRLPAEVIHDPHLVEKEERDQIESSKQVEVVSTPKPGAPVLSPPNPHPTAKAHSIPESAHIDTSSFLTPGTPQQERFGAQNVLSTFGQLASEQGYSQEEIAHMKFSLFHPGQAKPPLVQVMRRIKLQAEQIVGNKMGLPEDWSASFDIERFETALTLSSDKKFQSLLDKQVSGGALLRKQANTLRFMHYYPDVSFAEKEALLPQLAQLESEVSAFLQETRGIPKEHSIAPGKERYTQALTRLMGSEVNRHVTSHTLPLSPEVLDQVQTALQNPNDPSLSPEIKTLASQFLIAINTVKGEYGIPPAWTPSIESINQSSHVTKARKLNENTFDLLFEKIDLSVRFSQSRPESLPILEMARALSDALMELRMTVSQQMVSDAETQAKISDIIKTATEKLEAANTFEDEKTKREAESVSTWIDRTIGNLMSLALCFLVPPPLCLIAIGAFVMTTIEKESKGTDAFSKACKDVINDMDLPGNVGPITHIFQEIDKGIEKDLVESGKEKGDPEIELAQFGAKFGILTASYLFFGPGNTMEMASMSKMSEDVVRTFADAAAPDSDVAIAAMVLEAAVALIIAIAMAVFSANPAQVANASSNLVMTLTTVSEVVATSADIAGQIASIVRIAAELAILDKETEVDKANIEIQGHIKAMKQVLNKLYGAGDLAAAWQQEIQQIVNKYHSKNTQMMSKIAGANYA